VASAPETGGARPGWLGARTRVEGGRLFVSVVPRETPAWTAGVNVDDEIVAIDDFRVPPDQLDQRLQACTPGQSVTLLVSRRDVLKRLDVTLGTAPNQTWTIERLPAATPAAQAHLAAWLGAAPTAG